MTRTRSISMLALASVAGACLALAPAATAGTFPGSLDTDFNSTGFAVTDLPPADGSDEGQAVAVQENRRVVVAGHAGDKLALVRYRANGALDSSFSKDGLAKTSAGASQSWQAVEALSNGKIVAAGAANQPDAPELGSEVVVGRYLSNGKLDKSFSGDGIKEYGYGNGLDRAFGLVPMGSKLLVVGDTNSEDTGFDFALARLTGTGRLDRSFGDGGKLVEPVAPADGNDSASEAVRTGNGSFVVAGGSDQPTTGDDFTLAKFDSSGELDPDFDGDSGNGNGIVTTPVAASGSFDDINDAASGEDGRIVVAGRVDVAGQGSNFGAARYLEDGTLDDAFAGDGTTILAAAPGNGDDTASSVAVQDDGSVIAAGEADVDTTAATNKNAALARFTSAGVLDAGFDGDSGNGNGVVTTAFGPPSLIDRILGVAIDADGRLVAGGAVDPVGTGFERNFLAARYLLAVP